MQENSFTDIVGCAASVASTISQISIEAAALSFDNTDFTQRNLPSYDVDYYLGFNSKLRDADEAVNSLESSDPRMIGDLVVKPECTYFVNNTYLDVSMGVTMVRGGSFNVRGSLHKAFSVVAIDFSGEQYRNIMGHTSEHLQFVIKQIKG